MKKIYTLLMSVMAFVSLTKAQDTVFYESFDFQKFYDSLQTVSTPPQNTTDNKWYNWDGDGLADASNQNRQSGWFAVQPFADVDTLYANGDTNVAIGSSSWLVSPSLANNWLISPSIQLGPKDTLFWKSAPSQTPRYLDGYQVKISTSDNFDASFTTNLFEAAEMTSNPAGGIADTVFSNFTFAPLGAFVHGLDGTYIQNCNLTAPNPAHSGILKPFSIPLNTYANQKIFIAFVHNSTDDNLISIDDFMIRGDRSVGINETTTSLNVSLFPNPATDKTQLSFELIQESKVVINVYDVTGKLVYAESKGKLPNGRHFTNINTAIMAKGFYTVSVLADNAQTTMKLLVK